MGQQQARRPVACYPRNLCLSHARQGADRGHSGRRHHRSHRRGVDGKAGDRPPHSPANRSTALSSAARLALSGLFNGATPLATGQHSVPCRPLWVAVKQASAWRGQARLGASTGQADRLWHCQAGRLSASLSISSNRWKGASQSHRRIALQQSRQGKPVGRACRPGGAVRSAFAEQRFHYAVSVRRLSGRSPQ